MFQDEFLEELKTRLISLAGDILTTLPSILIALVILFLTRYAAMAVEHTISVMTSKFVYSKSLRSLFIQIGRVATWLVSTLFVCTVAFPEVNVGHLINLLGLSSVAIGFAFQDIFKNFLAGILLLLNQTFKLHDEIIVEGFKGEVEAISIRTTSIRTYQGELIIIPNALIFTSPVQVLTSQPYRRTDLAIGVDYNTPLNVAIETLLSAVGQVDGILAQPQPEVDAVNFGDSSIDFLVRYWTAPKTRDVRRAQSRMIIALKVACDKANINIPYPIRTVYHYDQQQFSDNARQS